MSGTLYIVATPIGNLEDITLRALRILREVDLIACEDTRQTLKLLHHYGIRRPLVSYHAHNQRKRAEALIARLKEGQNVALVSDAGTPLLSDPGEVLLERAIAERIRVVPIPGPSAITTAAMAAGLPVDRFLFVGFLPARRGPRRAELETLRALPYTLIFFEAPHRLAETLVDMCEILGARPAVLARELTKVHETFERATLAELVERVAKAPIKGEIVLLVAGAETARPADVEATALAERVKAVMSATGLDAKTAIRCVAEEYGVSRREVYRAYLSHRQEVDDA
ncbi:MAG: 16S rRNA (cytidine(1402)-2'-O)-methyltransferase [Blastocatellia bacterium]|nr:16S rRNA (cytidine(1402)-2'-O)-methyltransferase [Blastocatellia bacterium]MCS7157494.1 16S rRNA (cytidine(1402)-2'-O)-methyltransferase [Blastocatellia bacterium]MCX7752667.1 16S rRNA (cytidine(1402)-2'-O)-methyltransferase [Blastocatellia bacterium]MDW8168398.1 16S rRNA (cytidine(1402)-2'-O)-methyltransferase [Acidobacteriota bacterium]MDW8255594.1 16S rRNA (cytidine(1402)-2'-O)-methyltransferase [Acidobacteriota bacterium]